MARLSIYLALVCGAFAFVVGFCWTELILTLGSETVQATVTDVRVEPRRWRRSSTRYHIEYRFADAAGRFVDGKDVLYSNLWQQHPQRVRTLDIHYSTLNSTISRVYRPFVWAPWLLIVICLGVFGFLVLRIVSRFQRYGWRALE